MESSCYTLHAWTQWLMAWLCPAKDPYAWVGYIATLCSSICYIPQIQRIRKTRSAKDISYAMFIIWIAGSTLWLTYGLRTMKYPIILTNSINLVFRLWVLLYKTMADRRAASSR